MANKTFVGLLVLTKIPDGGSEKLVALLQRRGKINTDSPDGFKWQSYSGLCEVTTFGRAEAGETIEQALEREMTEELGPVAAKTILSSGMVKLVEKREEDFDVIHVWTAFCDRKIFKEIKLDISTAGIEIIKKEDVDKIDHVYISNEKQTVSDLNKIVAFEIPKDILKKAFELFENK